MDGSRLAFYGSIAVILGVTLLSGPAVGLVDLTTPRIDNAGLGQGNATVDAVEAPTTARIDRSLQSESYKLEVPDARIHVASITGQPVVSYKISIREMGYSRGTTSFLDADDTGWIGLSLESEALAPSRVSQSEYRGTLSITLRYNETEELLYEEPVTVEVTE